LQELAHQEQQQALEAAHALMQEFHEGCRELFEKFGIPANVKIPEIRVRSSVRSSEKEREKLEDAGYDEQPKR
jgi:hypothetical protein